MNILFDGILLISQISHNWPSKSDMQLVNMTGLQVHKRDKGLSLFIFPLNIDAVKPSFAGLISVSLVFNQLCLVCISANKILREILAR